MKLVLVQPQLRVNSGTENLVRVRAALDRCDLELGHDDIVLLPEALDTSERPYDETLSSFAQARGCHVVGGSHREGVQGRTLNFGLVFGPDGSVGGRYEKLFPYGRERETVHPGSVIGEVSIGGQNVLVLVCADFFSLGAILRRVTREPDLILVAALSVTRKKSPDYARAVWRHTAIARAYECCAFVGISDWGFPSELPSSFSSGVAAFVDPTAVDPRRMYRALGGRSVAVFSLDFAALAEFRADRSARGFRPSLVP